MAIGGTVHHDLRGLEERLRLHPRELLAADVRTKNRTAASTRSEAVRQLSRALGGVKAGAIRRQIRMQRATPQVPRAVLEFSHKRFRLFGNVNVRQTKRGVPLSRLPWRMEALDGDVIPPQALTHAFIHRGRQSGVPNVWIRVGTSRYPITAILVSSVSTAFRDRGLGTALIAYGRARQRSVFAQEMKFRVSNRLSRSA
jgi:hypothetical protein